MEKLNERWGSSGAVELRHDALTDFQNISILSF